MVRIDLYENFLHHSSTRRLPIDIHMFQRMEKIEFCASIRPRHYEIDTFKDAGSSSLLSKEQRSNLRKEQVIDALVGLACTSQYNRPAMRSSSPESRSFMSYFRQ